MRFTFAARALASQFGDAARKQLNKDAILEIALEDLHNSPPTPTQSNSGPEELSDEFISRFEDYASSASSEELRERWARVLACEIRQPGNFSRAVLRVIDEIDPVTAALFERTCESRFADIVFRPLTGQLEFETTKRLVEGGLLVEPGLGHMNAFAKTKLVNGRDIWLMSLGDTAIGFDGSKTTSSVGDDGLIMNGDVLSMPVYVLTSVGRAVSLILEDKTVQAVQRLVRFMSDNHPDLVTFSRVGESMQYKFISGKFSDVSNETS